MQEDEAYSLDSIGKMTLLRSTNYISWKIQFNENSSITNTAYFQVDLKNSSDRRILYDGDLNIALNGKLAFTLSLNFRYDSEPHGGLGKTYTQIKNGIEYNF
jgi:putative salt-induced outer membrane protein YdiY